MLTWLYSVTENKCILQQQMQHGFVAMDTSLDNEKEEMIKWLTEGL